jgi:hypothetical protein
MASDFDATSFSNLSRNVSLFTPRDAGKGQLVIICTWMGAAPKHVAKYSAAYRKIAPTSRILVINCGMEILTTSFPKQRESQAPAVEVIQAVLDESAQEAVNKKGATQILLQVFSSGGANSATHLLTALNERLKAPLPLTGLICDSAPARGTYWRRYNAIVHNLPRSLLAKIIGPLVSHIICIVLYLALAYYRYTPPEDTFRNTLLDDKLISSSDGGQNRICYFASKKDKMVDWLDVRSHAEEARNKGWDVEEIIFEDTSHVNHMPKHEEQYLMVVKSVWDGRNT